MQKSKLAKEVVFVQVSQLTPHPLSVQLYGLAENTALTQQIKEAGQILQPLLVDQSNRILAGCSRWTSAKALAFEVVPVVYFNSTNELQIRHAVISSNVHRAKTTEQVGKEYKELLEIRAKRRGNKQGGRPEKTVLKSKGLSLADEVKQTMGVTMYAATTAAKKLDKPSPPKEKVSRVLLKALQLPYQKRDIDMDLGLSFSWYRNWRKGLDNAMACLGNQYEVEPLLAKVSKRKDFDDADAQFRTLMTHWLEERRAK